jgi:hypothetical protein
VSNFLLLAMLLAGPLLAGLAIGIVVDAALQLRALRSTGHVRDCPGLRGWTCDCRDSEPAPGRIGTRDRDGAGAPAGLLVLPDAGSPAEGERARLPGLRSGSAARPAVAEGLSTRH